MGNDGGTIASRQDILSLHSYGKNGENEKIQIVDDENSDLTKCALSSSLLYGPEGPIIVSDYKGKLYDKLEVLKYMLKQKSSNDLIDTKNNEVTKIASPFSHLRSLRDIVDVHVNWKANSSGARPTIECPVTKELNSNTVYAYLRPCGCVLSFKILEEFDKYFAEKRNKSDKRLKDFDCPNCGELFCFKLDVVILNPRDVKERTEFNKRSFNLLQDLQLTHSKKPMKIKKKKKDKSEHKGLSESRKRPEDANETTNLTKKTKI
mmetsp:Transcript_6521/g.8192  ORF Transcript_6521/g.8192 Transcript_6521/m.8192 type:complete len:263 (-) Transcript_6521:15-803(-)